MARPSSPRALRLAVAALALLGAACGGGGGRGGPVHPPVAALLPDFSLPDVNPASARFGDDVSPRQYLTQASAWYFGHAT